MARCEFISRATTFLFMLLASVIAAVAQEVPAAISLTVAEDPTRLRPIPEAIYSTPLPLAVRLPGLSKNEDRRLSRRGGITRAGVRRRLATMSYRPWITASTDGQVVKFAISSPGALQMRIHFRNFDVGNAEVWVHAPGAEFAPAPYRNKGIFADGEFWSASVIGDTAVISVLRDSATSWSGMPFEIDQVVHYWPTLDQSADDPVGANPAAPASCHLDVTCYASFNLAAKAVALYSLISSDDDNVYLCSGSLINTRAGSLKPYFLTAH